MKFASQLSNRATVFLVFALLLADVTSAFETIMIYTAVRDLLEEYGRPETIGWLLSGYLLVAAGTAAICGRLGDLYGRKLVLIVTLSGTVVGSLISLFSPSLEGVILGRSIQGLSGAALPLALGLAREHVPSKYLNTSVAVITASAALGAGIGLIVGGYIVDTFGWRHIFSASAIIAIITVLLCVLAIPKSPAADVTQKLDLIGGLLFVPAIAFVLLGISKGHEWNWDMRVWSAVAGGGALLTAWILHELRHPNPLLDVRLLKSRTIALTNICGAIAAVGVLHYTQLMMLLLQQPQWTGIGLGLTATAAALFKAPGNFVTTAISPLWGHLADKWGPSRVFVLGMSVLAVSCGMLVFLYNAFWVVVTIALFGSIGVAASYTAIPIILVRAAPLGRVSETVGISSVIRAVGMAIGSQAMLTVLAASTVVDPAGGVAEFPAVKAYQLTFALMTSACIAAICVALTIPRSATAVKPQPVPAPTLSN